MGIIAHDGSGVTTLYLPEEGRARTRSEQIYRSRGICVDGPPSGLPVTVELNMDGSGTQREVGPVLASGTTPPEDFLQYLYV